MAFNTKKGNGSSVYPRSISADGAYPTSEAIESTRSGLLGARTDLNTVGTGESGSAVGDNPRADSMGAIRRLEEITGSPRPQIPEYQSPSYDDQVRMIGAAVRGRPQMMEADIMARNPNARAMMEYNAQLAEREFQIDAAIAQGEVAADVRAADIAKERNRLSGIQLGVDIDNATLTLNAVSQAALKAESQGGFLYEHIGNEVVELGESFEDILLQLGNNDLYYKDPIIQQEMALLERILGSSARVDGTMQTKAEQYEKDKIPLTPQDLEYEEGVIRQNIEDASPALQRIRDRMREMETDQIAADALAEELKPEGFDGWSATEKTAHTEDMSGKSQVESALDRLEKYPMDKTRWERLKNSMVENWIPDAQDADPQLQETRNTVIATMRSIRKKAAGAAVTPFEEFRNRFVVPGESSYGQMLSFFQAESDLLGRKITERVRLNSGSNQYMNMPDRRSKTGYSPVYIGPDVESLGNPGPVEFEVNDEQFPN